MSKFKKGDKVRVVPFNKENYLKKKDLKAMRDEFADVWALAAGNVYKVAYWRTLFGVNQYELEGIEDWVFDEWMLEPVEDAPLTPTGENVNRCVCCGEIIPEGRQVCPACESGQEPHIKDSGERTEYATGAVRDCKEGKGRFDLMPLDVVAEMYPGSEFLHLVSAAKQRGSGCLVDALCNLAEEVNWGCGENEVIPTNRRKSAMLLEIAKHFEEGAKKYGENNWQKGIPVHSYIDSAVRHYIKHMAGWRDEPHDRAAAWNIMCCVWTMWHHPELDDWTEKVVAVDGSK